MKDDTNTVLQFLYHCLNMELKPLDEQQQCQDGKQLVGEDLHLSYTIGHQIICVLCSNLSMSKHLSEAGL